LRPLASIRASGPYIPLTGQACSYWQVCADIVEKVKPTVISMKARMNARGDNPVLSAAGLEPTLIEQAQTLRADGYVIDFWGLRYGIAGRMGLLDSLNRVGYHMQEMRVVNSRGERVTGFGTRVFDELTGGKFVTLARGNLSRLLFEKVRDSTEVLFGDKSQAFKSRQIA
jgi:hypothetical protein